MLKACLAFWGACVKCGEEIEFICEGADEVEALEGIIKAVFKWLSE